MTQKTESEALFERFCDSNGLPLRSVPRQSDTEVKTPDYEVRLGDTHLVVEVKQLDLGPKDKVHLKELEERRETPFVVNEKVARIRKKIKDAMPQLKAASSESNPTMLVLYDSVRLLGDIDGLDVRVALYGDEVVDIGVPSDPAVPAYVKEHRFGGNRSVSISHNTSLSSIGVLHSIPDSETNLDIYHNDFAANPLDPELLRVPSIQHFRLEPTVTQGAFRRWIQVE